MILLDIVNADRIDPVKGFIHQEELRSREERPDNLQPPPLASAQGEGSLSSQMLQAQFFEVSFDQFLSFRAGQ